MDVTAQMLCCKLANGESGLLLGCPCVVISELVEVYEGFRDRENERRMVARGRVGVYGGEMEAGVSDLRYLSQKDCMVAVACA